MWLTFVAINANTELDTNLKLEALFIMKWAKVIRIVKPRKPHTKLKGSQTHRNFPVGVESWNPTTTKLSYQIQRNFPILMLARFWLIERINLGQCMYIYIYICLFPPIWNGKSEVKIVFLCKSRITKETAQVGSLATIHNIIIMRLLCKIKTSKLSGCCTTNHTCKPF